MGNVKLSDFRGRWLVLFFHPADFTPVCTSEFISLSRAADKFAALDCALLAVSIDSLYSHLAWVRAIHDHFDVTVSFPVVEDPSMVIGRAYGMIDDAAIDAGTMRSTYFIDPHGFIRARTCYPATVGRSVDELLRVVAALQRVDADNVVTPEGWNPGEDLLMPPATHQDEILAIEAEGAWFHRLRTRNGGDGA